MLMINHEGRICPYRGALVWMESRTRVCVPTESMGYFCLRVETWPRIHYTCPMDKFYAMPEEIIKAIPEHYRLLAFLEVKSSADRHQGLWMTVCLDIDLNLYVIDEYEYDEAKTYGPVVEIVEAKRAADLQTAMLYLARMI